MRLFGAWIVALLLGAQAPSSAQVLLSEIRIDDQNSPTNNDPNEYFELRASPDLPPGSPMPMLGDLTYVVIGRRPIQMMGGVPYGGAGVIVGVFKFPANAQIPPSGRYLVREPTMQLPIGAPPAQLVASLPFEDDATQTHLLVRNFDFAMFAPGYSPVGFDLDIDNDGTLDIIPWEEVLDAVSFLKTSVPDAENRAYAQARVGPAFYGIPAHIFRCQNTFQWRCGRRPYTFRNVVSITRNGPTTTPFDAANPYAATITGAVETASAVRIRVTLEADTSHPSAAFDVFIGGVHLQTITGVPDCDSSPPRFVTAPMNLFNSVLIANGMNSIPVAVVPNAFVGGGCASSFCQVTLLYEGADQQTADTPGLPNQMCGGGCDQPNPFTTPPCCLGDLTGDGVVDNSDLQFYLKLKGFSYRDVNNDGQPGSNTLDRPLVDQPWGPCGPQRTCGITQVSCLAAHALPGCSYAPCCEAVCNLPGFDHCCTTTWDSLCVTAALALPECAPCGPISFTQNCFVPGASPGCSDPACCALVCLQPGFEYCCVVEWDAACAAEARNACLFCGSTASLSCFVPSNLPFCAEAWCCERVCALPDLAFCCSVAWDASCAAAAKTLCGKCGDANLQPCTETSLGPGCRNKDCCETVCLIDPACCSIAWDAQCAERAVQLCLECGSALAGSCCLPRLTPYCDDSTCCDLVCQYDPFCCSSQWDGLCVTIASITCTNLVCPCGSNPASCFSTHSSPGCNEKLCCYTVCTYDNFCCLVTWDSLCVAFANAWCSTNGACIPGAGSCTVPHPTPGCDSPASCCTFVCQIQPQCCTVAWDMECVGLAFAVCLNCGDPAAGSCYTASGSPGCSDPVCCTSVCDADPFCCVIGWDGACVGLAFALCGDPLASCSGTTTPNRNCFMASRGRGCRPTTCCTKVCEIDPFCCTSEWDAICAQEAFLFCPLAGNTNGIGNCFVPKCCGGPGCYSGANCRACGDRGCASAVCAYRASCCTTLWDAECAALANAVCINKEPCPTDASCNTINRGPGCDDPSCCNAVCALDPHCCTVRWDNPCVQTARTICAPESGWSCPCSGGCFEAKSSPGCNDSSCCAAVCRVSPACCTLMWDTDCVRIARDLCCGMGLCGDPCNKSCLEVHPQPYCNDSWCCEAVCAVDPFCCASTWDTLCVQIAFQRCAGVCGQPTSGNCFAEHLGTGCSIGACCREVCLADPTCCSEEWDAACATLARSLGPCITRRPKCGEALAGPCCVAGNGPACNHAPCCNAVCQQDPTCCTEEWDDLCVSIARNATACAPICNPPCGATCADSCCKVHPTPRCNHLECCEAVCFGWTDVNGVVYGGDSYCCNVDWDANCVSRALEYSQIIVKGGQVLDGPCRKACPLPRCGELAGDCCAPHPEPFCIEAACCTVICANDPFCCEVSWDANCATAALSLCASCAAPSACGAPGSGSCFTPNFTPYCTDQACCELVCAVDQTCCQVQWDFDCVQQALLLCFSGPLPPINDQCVDAIPFEPVDPAAANLRIFSTTGATTSLVPSPAMPCTPDAIIMEADAWWIIEFTQEGVWEISTCNLANFDTAIAIYEHPCESAVLRACDDRSPFCAQFTSTVTWCAQANQPYLVRIGSPSGATGSGVVLIRRLGPCP